MPAWAMDSGGYTELHRHGRWTIGPREYADFVRRCDSEIGSLCFVAPQDWMCEESSLKATGLTVEGHQKRTVENFLLLRDMLGPKLIPVLQGESVESYLRCIREYDRHGVNLALEPLVGLGSVCRRQSSKDISLLVREMHPLNLHGFGVKKTGLSLCDPTAFASVDSLAWSFRGRKLPPLPGCETRHKNCANCYKFASQYRAKLLSDLEFLR